MDKTTIKTLGDAVGLPDEVDKERIRKMILRYDDKHPGYIKHAIEEARAQHALLGGKTTEYGEVNKQAGGRLLFELPQGLYKKIDEAYPLMFREKSHLRWFIKHFKELLIPERY